MTSKPLAFAVLFLATIAGFPASASAEETNYEKALAEITKTAERICQSAPLEQTSEGLSLTGEAQAKLGGILGKIADLGVSGAGKYESGKSLGVLQKDLIQAIQIGNNCKLEVFKVLERDLIQNRSSSTVASPQATPSRKKEHFVDMGGNNWQKFPKDVRDARYDCLHKLFLYGTHPENFVANPKTPSEFRQFVGAISMQLSRDSKSLEIDSIDFRITPFFSDNRTLDTERMYGFTCQFQKGQVVSSSFL